jgi:hypothetical protein
MAGHLASGAVRVFLSTEKAQELVARRLAEKHRHPRVAIIRVEVVVTGTQVKSRPDLGSLLSLAGDHERSLALAVQDPRPLVYPPREKHVVVHPAQVVLVQTKRLVPGPGLSDRHRPPPLLKGPRERSGDYSSTNRILADHRCPDR